MIGASASRTREAPTTISLARLVLRCGCSTVFMAILLSQNTLPRPGRGSARGRSAGAAIRVVESPVEGRLRLASRGRRVLVDHQHGLAPAVWACPGMGPVAGEAAAVPPGEPAARREAD